MVCKFILLSLLSYFESLCYLCGACYIFIGFENRKIVVYSQRNIYEKSVTFHEISFLKVHVSTHCSIFSVKLGENAAWSTIMYGL